MLEAPSHALYFSTTGKATHMYFIVWGFVNNDRERKRERERETDRGRDAEGECGREIRKVWRKRDIKWEIKEEIDKL